jgi:hypothetical protein
MMDRNLGIRKLNGIRLGPETPHFETRGHLPKQLHAFCFCTPGKCFSKAASLLATRTPLVPWLSSNSWQCRMLPTLNSFLEKELYNSACRCYSSDCLTLQRPPAVRAWSEVMGSCLLSDVQLWGVRCNWNGGTDVEVVEIHATTGVLTI